MWFLTWSMGFSLCFWQGLSRAASPIKFEWSTVTPSAKLHYHACYDGFECARLSVPRNWLGAKNNKTVEVAVIRLPATVPSEDPSFGGSIITNPGGPGGSGVGFLTGPHGRVLQKITSGKRNYEIVSFDPRGVENTTPRADCFGGSHLLARDAFMLELKGTGGMAAGESALKRSLALAGGLGALCEDVDLSEDIMAYISTASVARDIIEIADRIEEHREAEQMTTYEGATQAPLQDSGPGKTAPRVLYWGFSYGTVLGNTLASMFPGRMGRVILDGVVDIHDYMKGEWRRNLLDTENIIAYFYDTCFEAGDDCPLWRAEDTAGGDIKNRIDKLIADTNTNPVVFSPADNTSIIRVITGFDIHNVFRDPVYAPMPRAFQQLATALAEALQGNYSLIGPDPYLEPPLQDVCGIESHSPGNAQTAILCGDSLHFDPTEHPRGANFSFWQDYVKTLQSQSITLASFWARIASSCSGWRIRPHWGFKGPWTTPRADPSLKTDAPAAPILFTSSRLDPVTPLENAFRMSNAHPGSAVLVLDTVGHCAIGSGWSECFGEAIRAYLDDGVLPENGTVCADTTCKPFVDGGECQPPGELHSYGNDMQTHISSNWQGRPLGIPF